MKIEIQGKKTDIYCFVEFLNSNVLDAFNVKVVKNEDEGKKISPQAEDLQEFAKKYFAKKYLNNSTLQTFDRLIRIDKYDVLSVKKAIENAKNDAFWERNFISPNKLRLKNKEGVMYIDVFLSIRNQPQRLKQEFGKKIF